MAQRSNSARPVTTMSVPSSFQVGSHTIRVQKVMEGRWTVAVDDGASPSSYATQADAWEAGVREADRLDRVTVTA
jgi:hypothetical protein